MAKRKAKRKHSVYASIEVPDLSKAGTSLELEIFAESQKIAHLVIGCGSLYWYGRKRQKSKRISWSRFSAMMDELAVV